MRLKRSSLVVFVALWGLWFTHLTGWPLRIHINASASMPRGLWGVEALEPGQPIDRGDIVVVTPPEQARALGCVRTHQVLLKYVGGVAGDRVCVESGVVRLTGRMEPLARTRLRSPEAPGPRPVEGCFELGPEQIWVATPHERSCDSRYFGPITRADVRSRAWPLLTWETGQDPAPAYPTHPIQGGRR